MPILNVYGDSTIPFILSFVYLASTMNISWGWKQGKKKKIKGMLREFEAESSNEWKY